ncbi:MAG: UDP-N-acetylmuramoyl-tripeptide--D-alanyl-D-alanine ligase [Paracoccaceae bacterium]|jgi:UDP-N-acetylmuramoyl-tripeptide--D-alanyl-D-alanine ligase|nr:UDP-N-acetylmuramoyl-tripeptide--D-alanyl-D-alanine ligase [Paracoccaceae bacterium]
MKLWTAEEAIAATGGTAQGEWVAVGVSIDTRTLRPGDLFVALKAERDGHDFVADALKKGAAAALVSRIPENVPDDAPLLIVGDVLQGLEALGLAARQRTRAKVVAVTGSVGKTSTKEMLRIVLSGQGKTHAAEASYNNHWGVPLTLARMPVDTDFAVIEVGMNHPGEIAPLAKMAKPHVALVTTVAPAHLEAFESVDAIAHEKAAVFTGLVEGGIAIINADISTAEILRNAAAPQTTYSFGEADDANFRAKSVEIIDQTTLVQCDLNGQPAVFKINALGRHFAMNAMGAIAVVDSLGLDFAVALGDIGRWVPPVGRGTRERLVMDIVEDHLYFDLIDDAFNANPTSMLASFEVLSAAKKSAKGRCIAVLGDMLELGDEEISMHRSLSDSEFFSQIDVVHCVGPKMKALYDELPELQAGRWTETASELARCAHSFVHAGDVLLVKGSKGSKVSLVVDAVRKLGHSAPISEEEGG